MIKIYDLSSIHINDNVNKSLNVRPIKMRKNPYPLSMRNESIRKQVTLLLSAPK